MLRLLGPQSCRRSRRPRNEHAPAAVGAGDRRADVRRGHRHPGYGDPQRELGQQLESPVAASAGALRGGLCCRLCRHDWRSGAAISAVRPTCRRYICSARCLWSSTSSPITWAAPRIGVGNAVFFVLLGQLIAASGDRSFRPVGRGPVADHRAAAIGHGRHGGGRLSVRGRRVTRHPDRLDPRRDRRAVRSAVHRALFRAAEVHRAHHAPDEVQLCTLLSIKTGGCPEDCGYCSQIGLRRYRRSRPTKLMDVRRRPAAGGARPRRRASQRFCMGAAWRNPKDRDMAARRRDGRRASRRWGSKPA